MKYTLLILLITSTLISCSNNDPIEPFIPTLPPITQIGANTFGCYIDGNLLTPRDGSGTIGGMGSQKGMKTYALGNGPDYIYNEIYIDDFKSEKGGLLRIHIIELYQNGGGTYTINESNCQNGLDANINININCRVYDYTENIFKWYCSIENAGVLTITRYDLENRIVSGIFSCTMQNRDNPDERIEITQGRFDYKWDTLNETDFP